MTSGGGVTVASYQIPSTPGTLKKQATQRALEVKSTPVWNSRTSPLSDVLRSHATPLVVRETSSNRHDDQRYVYVHSVSATAVAVADGLRLDARSGMTSTGRRYVIPVEHRGWFELLSQDGHAATPLSSVQQLMKASPERCLVRRGIVGMLVDDDNVRRTCKVAAGETITLEGPVAGSASNADSRNRCLRCRLDRTGETLVLSADQRGLFSPVAGPTSVAGVHRMRSIIAKFRFPVIVRLVTHSNLTSESSSNDLGSIAFRVVAEETELSAYLVPLFVIRSPSEVNRQSLLALPISTQTSSVIDGVASSAETSTGSAAVWTDARWNDLKCRCDELIKSRAVTAEISRVFPTQNTDDRHRRRPATSPMERPSSPAANTEDESRLLREIDDIYQAIKTGNGKNGVKTTMVNRRLSPRRHRSVRQDRGETLALGHSAVRTRSPARRSNTFDPSYLKQHQLQSQPSRQGTRLRHLTSHGSPVMARKRSPPVLQVFAEPIYDELRPVTSPEVDGHVTGVRNGNTGKMPDNGPYVLLTDGPVSAADNLRQVIKNPSTCRRSTVGQSRPRSFAGSGNSALEMELADDDHHRTTTSNTGAAPPLPAKRQPLNGDDGKSSQRARSGLIDRSISCSGLTSSSSDEVTADRKSSSAFGAISSTLKRALRRSATKQSAALSTASATGANDDVQRTRLEDLPEVLPYNQTDEFPVTSPTSNVMAVDFGTGKVTHF